MSDCVLYSVLSRYDVKEVSNDEFVPSISRCSELTSFSSILFKLSAVVPTHILYFLWCNMEHQKLFPSFS